MEPSNARAASPPSAARRLALGRLADAAGRGLSSRQWWGMGPSSRRQCGCRGGGGLTTMTRERELESGVWGALGLESGGVSDSGMGFFLGGRMTRHACVMLRVSRKDVFL